MAKSKRFRKWKVDEERKQLREIIDEIKSERKGILL